MAKKLTLNIDENIIDEAKTLAQLHGSSLSKLVETLLRGQIRNYKSKSKLAQFKPKGDLRKLYGLFKNAPIKSHDNDDRYNRIMSEGQ